MRYFVVLMSLMFSLPGMSVSVISVPMDSVLKQINQDTCLKISSNQRYCDSIQTVYVDRLLVENVNEIDVRMFYNWCMSEESDKSYRKLNKDWYGKKVRYTKFQSSCEYKLKYREIIDSLICVELRTMKYRSFDYQLYSKQIYCYESVTGEKMALVRCYICLKDDFRYNREDVMHIVFDSFPEEFFAVINLEKKYIKRFVLL